MKAFHTLASISLLALAAHSLATSTSSAQQPGAPKSLAMTFVAKDGQATATLTCDVLPVGPKGGEPLRTFKLFGAYIDQDLGLIGSELQTVGTAASPVPTLDLPKSLIAELGPQKLTLKPAKGSWASVKGEGDVIALFEPLAKK